MISSFAFAGHYPAKVNSDINLYADAEFNKAVVSVKEGAWLNTMPMFSTAEVRYGMGSLYISEEDAKKLVDHKPFAIEKGIFHDDEDDSGNASSPDVLVQKDTPIYSKSVLD